MANSQDLVKRINRPYLHMALTVFVIVAGAVLILVWAAYDDIGIHWMVFLVGTIGGVANNYRRLQHLPRDTNALADSGTSRLVTVQLYVSPLIGGIFAVVLYMLFLGGILQGALFPEFPHLQQNDYEGVSSFIKSATPAKGSDAAKLMFWSFVAGFSEAFVPNIIDKLAQEATTDS